MVPFREIFSALADRFGDLSSLAHAVTDYAIAVADNDQSRKLHNAAALNGFAYAVDSNDLFRKLIFGCI